MAEKNEPTIGELLKSSEGIKKILDGRLEETNQTLNRIEGKLEPVIEAKPLQYADQGEKAQIAKVTRVERPPVTPPIDIPKVEVSTPPPQKKEPVVTRVERPPKQKTIKRADGTETPLVEAKPAPKPKPVKYADPEKKVQIAEVTRVESPKKKEPIVERVEPPAPKKPIVERVTPEEAAKYMKPPAPEPEKAAPKPKPAPAKSETGRDSKGRFVAKNKSAEAAEERREEKRNKSLAGAITGVITKPFRAVKDLVSKPADQSEVTDAAGTATMGPIYGALQEITKTKEDPVFEKIGGFFKNLKEKRSEEKREAAAGQEIQKQEIKIQKETEKQLKDGILPTDRAPIKSQRDELISQWRNTEDLSKRDEIEERLMDLEVKLFKGFKSEEKALEDLSNVLYLGLQEDETRFQKEQKQAEKAQKIEDDQLKELERIKSSGGGDSGLDIDVPGVGRNKKGGIVNRVKGVGKRVLGIGGGAAGAAGAGAGVSGLLSGIPILAALAMGGKDLYDIVQSKRKGENVKDEDIGGAGGTAAGMLFGGIIGSIVPVIGTAIGAGIGGVLGNLFGEWLGKKSDGGSTDKEAHDVGMGSAAKDYLKKQEQQKKQQEQKEKTPGGWQGTANNMIPDNLKKPQLLEAVPSDSPPKKPPVAVKVGDNMQEIRNKNAAMVSQVVERANKQSSKNEGDSRRGVSQNGKDWFTSPSGKDKPDPTQKQMLAELQKLNKEIKKLNEDDGPMFPQGHMGEEVRKNKFY